MQTSISLKEVPDRYLDAPKWSAVQAFANNKLIALTYLNTPYPDYIYGSSWTLDGTDERLKACVETYHAGRSLLSQCRSLFNSGALIAVGTLDNGAAAFISRELWLELFPMFATERIVGRGMEFKNIRVIDSVDLNTPHEILLLECIAALKEEQLKGKRLKKELWPQLSERFGAQLIQRMFDAAYKVVFDSPRGRPFSN